MVLNRIYHRSPVTLQNLAVTSAGWLKERRRYGRAFRSAYANYQERQRWEPEQLEAFRRAQLLRTLKQASFTEFYAQQFERLGLEWREFAKMENFKLLPVVEKRDLQANPKAFEIRPHRRGDVKIRTSGTTGTSLTLACSGNVEPEQWAVWWRYRQWHGIDRETPMALFASAPVARPEESRVFWRKNWVGRETRYSIYHITRTNAPAYVDQLNRDSTLWIHGNPSAIALLALYMSEENLSLQEAPRWVTVGSENLTSAYSDAIQNAFGVKPVQHYGLAEANANFSECIYGNLHVDEDFALVEFLDPDEHGRAHIVGTSYANQRTAVLRYTTGDLATPSEATCECGARGRTVESLDGRQGDYLTIPSGARVASLATPFHATNWMLEGQLYQYPEGNLEVRYVPTRPVSADMESAFERILRERVGQEVRIGFREVDRISRTERGKPRLVVSDFESGGRD